MNNNLSKKGGHPPPVRNAPQNGTSFWGTTKTSFLSLTKTSFLLPTKTSFLFVTYLSLT